MELVQGERRKKKKESKTQEQDGKWEIVWQAGKAPVCWPHNSYSEIGRLESRGPL